MKLGIVVVYLVSAENEKLLDLHLSQIEKYTDVPYTIYGSTNRSIPAIRERLRRHPKIKICECPQTDLRGPAEHAYYLEQLTKYAIDDGASHVVTMHVDSFPIRLHWAVDLVAKLYGSCAFITLDGINTACLFFNRDFYLSHSPKFSISETEHDGKEYWQFQRMYDVDPQSGVGFAFKAYLQNLTWYYLGESVRGKDKTGIYDNKFFHLGSLVHLSEQNHETVDINTESKFIPVAEKIINWSKLIISRKIREFLRKYFRISIDNYIDNARIKLAKEMLQNKKEKLLANPEAYLQSLRVGNDH
jgi:hypothetical protein